MEKELRGLKGRGHFPIPTITPHGARVETPHHINKFLEAVDEEIVHLITTVRDSDRDYEKEKERARIRDQQTQASKLTHRLEYNFLTLNSSTPIKNTGTTAFQTTGNQNRHTERSIHFNPNPTHHLSSIGTCNLVHRMNEKNVVPYGVFLCKMGKRSVRSHRDFLYSFCSEHLNLHSPLFLFTY